MPKQLKMPELKRLLLLRTQKPFFFQHKAFYDQDVRDYVDKYGTQIELTYDVKNFKLLFKELEGQDSLQIPADGTMLNAKSTIEDIKDMITA